MDDQPPILGSWQQLYAIVLLLHAIIIALFYWFTHTFTA
jgi:hypothetical protein